MNELFKNMVIADVTYNDVLDVFYLSLETDHEDHINTTIEIANVKNTIEQITIPTYNNEPLNDWCERLVQEAVIDFSDVPADTLKQVIEESLEQGFDGYIDREIETIKKYLRDLKLAVKYSG